MVFEFFSPVTKGRKLYTIEVKIVDYKPPLSYPYIPEYFVIKSSK